MWWCCGKEKPHAIGCKVQKHITKEDNDEESDDDIDKAKKIKCYTCKQTGHTQQDCERDPNIRTLLDVDMESARVQKVLNMKKLTADAGHLTASLFEKLAMTNAEKENETLMTFDDFNYKAFNR